MEDNEPVAKILLFLNVHSVVSVKTNMNFSLARFTRDPVSNLNIIPESLKLPRLVTVYTCTVIWGHYSTLFNSEGGIFVC